MKLCIGALLFVAAVAAGQELLDRPIDGQTPLDVFHAMEEIHKRLPEQDAAAFANGVTGLTSEIKQWKKTPMTDAERDAYVFSVVRGMTQRQVIILGSLVRALLYRSTSLVETLKAKGSVGRAEYSDPHAMYFEDSASRYLSQYLKRANQVPEPTSGSVTPRADARVAPPPPVAHR